MSNHTTRAQRINARQDKIWEQATLLSKKPKPIPCNLPFPPEAVGNTEKLDILQFGKILHQRPMTSHNLGQGWIATAHSDGSMVVQNVNKNEYINLSPESLERLRQILQ